MAKKPKTQSYPAPAASAGRPSALVDTRVIYCGDNLDQLAKLPDACVDLIYIDPPSNPVISQGFDAIGITPVSERFCEMKYGSV